MTGSAIAPVIVTGGRQGIGRAIAEAFAATGRPVVIADIAVAADADEPSSGAGAGPIHAWHADVTDEASIEALFDRVAAEFGQPASCLVNNAAVQVWGGVLEQTADDFRRTFDVNVVGTFLMTQAFARRLVQVGDGSRAPASVVNLGSGCNTRAFPMLSSYVASKGAIEAFTKSLALELGEHGIRVNCIAPGAIETDRTRAETEGYAERWTPLTPLGRIGTVADVARAVVALCDDAFGFVTGQTLGVDGGLFERAVWPEDY